jgi:hypothetical protein
MKHSRSAGWLLGALLAVFSIAGTAQAQGVGLWVWPVPAALETGDSLTIQLRVLDPGPLFNAYEATLHYDPAVLQFVPRSRSDEEGVTMRDACGNTFYRFDAVGDSIVVADALLCDHVSLPGPATLLDLRFVAIGGEQVTWVRLTGAAVFQDGLYVTPLVTHDASVRIINTLGVPPRGSLEGGMRLSVSPNPARGAVAFALEGAPSDRGEVVVCDLSGRAVARVPLSAGVVRGVATWEGRGNDGRDLPPGVYTAMIRTAHGTARTRFVRLR